MFNVSADGHKIIAVNGNYETVAEGSVEELLTPSEVRRYAKEANSNIAAVYVTE